MPQQTSTVNALSSHRKDEAGAALQLCVGVLCTSLYLDLPACRCFKLGCTRSWQVSHWHLVVCMEWICISSAVLGLCVHCVCTAGGRHFGCLLMTWQNGKPFRDSAELVVVKCLLVLFSVVWVSMTCLLLGLMFDVYLSMLGTGGHSIGLWPTAWVGLV